MKRLVYSPKAYVYIQTDEGMYNISDLVVAGSINRKINQVSTAEVTFQNPDFTFTQPGTPTFRPMDKITIFLQRLPGFPVQSFTGYLDETPYFQMYPGTVTLRASCTLKRLQHTYFDPGLPFMIAFMSRYGWLTDGNGSIQSVTTGSSTSSEVKRILLIGDSLGVGTSGPLSELAEVIQDAVTGRSSASGLAALRRKLANTTKYTQIVLDLGTNDPDAAALKASLESAVDAVDQAAPIFVPTVHGPDAANKNKIIRNTPGITAIEWNETLNDGIHPTADGYKNRARVVFNQLKASTQPTNPKPADEVQAATSASMTDLMYACLKHIAGIDPGQILIEELPQDLIDRISVLYQGLHANNDESAAQFTTWLADFVGGEQGSGGTTFGGDEESVGDDASGVPYATLITKWAKVYNFDPALIAAIIERESNFQAGAIGHDPGGTVGQGLMQLTSEGYKTWIRGYLADGEGAVSANVHAGCRALREKVSIAGDLWLGVKAYNGSGSAADEYMADVKNNRYPKFQEKFRKSGSVAEPKEEGSETQTKSGTTMEDRKKNETDDGDREQDRVSGTTRYDAIVAEANKLSRLATNGKMPYGPDRPPVNANDCSSSCTLLLKAAGYQVAGWPTTASIKSFMKPGKDPSGRVTFWNSDVSNVSGGSVHIWASINGRPFTTADSLGGHWKDDYYAKDNPASHGFQPFHVPKLDEPHEIPADADLGTGGAGTGSDGGSGFNDALAAARAASVFTTLNFPQAVDAAESILLTGSDARGKSLMNDQPLLPFIEQLANGSLRNFMSLPNGDFYAFHPDYFGAMGTSPYWEIDDIEVLEGGIQLSDDALATHVFVVGATLPDQQFDIVQKLNTHGVVNILNAGTVDFLNVDPVGAAEENAKSKADAVDGRKTKVKEEELRPFLGSEDAATSFLQRYGARPLVEEAPFIRSHIFETFYAYQKFMLAWARQFQTTFSFTFMPEIYPGGIVSFKGHGIQMYVDEVHHSWDYESGFTTQANLTAPSGTDDEHKGISRGMVRSFINRKDQ